MEGPHSPGFVLSDCHRSSSSVPHLAGPPLKRRHNAHLNFAGSSLYPIYHFHHELEAALGIQNQALHLWVEEGKV